MRCLALVVMAAMAAPALAAGFDVDGLKLGASTASLPKAQFKCEPMKTMPKQTVCRRTLPGTVFGVAARKFEVAFKDGRSYIIFVGFAPTDTPKAGKFLEQRYGKPKSAREVVPGAYQVHWVQGKDDLYMDRNDKRNEASVSLTRG